MNLLSLVCYSSLKFSLSLVLPLLSNNERDPCQPSPCGANSECRANGENPSCSCLKGFIGIPPNCRPECVSNADCSSSKACIKQKCVDPCSGVCGSNSQCHVVNHTPMCYCDTGFTGDPFTNCIKVVNYPSEDVRPCDPNPCGPNAECFERDGAGACSCLPEFFGNPYEGCRLECVLNSDCSAEFACIQNKCQDPCPGTCGVNAECYVRNHLPTCNCLPAFSGDPYSYCVKKSERKLKLKIGKKNCFVIRLLPTAIYEIRNPCKPSPCGSNSECREVENQAVCSCLPSYIGSPPACRPECTLSSECDLSKACIYQKCIDPCNGICGLNAECRVHNHSPLCSCRPGYTGDSFVRCFRLPLERKTN